MAILDDVKTVLRVTTTAFDTEIRDLVEAAKEDLEITGVDTMNESNPLIKRAIILYCKAYFGYDNPDAQRLEQSYEMLKAHLSVSTDFHTYPVEDES